MRLTPGFYATFWPQACLLFHVKQGILMAAETMVVIHVGKYLNMSVFEVINQTPYAIEMKGITRSKISESAVCKKFLGQIVSYPASL